MKKSILSIAALSLLLLAGCSKQNQNELHHKSSVQSSYSSRTPKKHQKQESKRNDAKLESKQSSQSSAQSVSKPKPENKKMDFAQIEKGNYSSLQGNWQLVKAIGRNQDVTDTADDTLTITPNLLKTSAMSLTAAGLKDQNGSNKVKYTLKGDSLVMSLKDESVAINWAVYFYPAGATNFEVNGEKQTPPTKNTIVVWTSNGNYSEVYEQK